MRRTPEPCARLWRATACVLLGSLLLVGCGIRVDHAQVVAEAAGGTVTLSPETIRALTRSPARSGNVPTTLVRPPGATAPGVTAPGGHGSLTAAPPLPVRPPSRAATVTRAEPATATATGSLARPQPTPARLGAAACPVALAPVAVGQVGLFSGVAGPITGSMRGMLGAWARDLNDRGGLACHPVVVYTADDGGDPSQSAYLVQDMVTRHHVVAFIAPAILSPNAFIPAVEAAKVPVIGGPGAEEFRHSAWVFPESADNDDRIFGLVHNGVLHGKRKLGALYCVEVSACTQAAEKLKGIAKAAGAEEVYSAPVSFTQPDFTAQCLNARDAGVDQLALGLDGASIGRVARSCEAVGYHPLLSTVAELLSPAQAADTLVRSFGIATATGEVPWVLEDTPGLREYHRVLARWAPNVAPDGASIIAFTAAKLFETAIARVADAAAHGPITPTLILDGLTRIHDESLGGLTVGLTFRPGQKDHPSSGCVFYEFLTTTGWIAPQGSRPVCSGR